MNDFTQFVNDAIRPPSRSFLATSPGDKRYGSLVPRETTALSGRGDGSSL